MAARGGPTKRSRKFWGLCCEGAGTPKDTGDPAHDGCTISAAKCQGRSVTEDAAHLAWVVKSARLPGLSFLACLTHSSIAHLPRLRGW